MPVVLSDELVILFWAGLLSIFLLAGFTVWRVIDNMWLTPQEAKEIKRAARRKKPMFYVEYDDGTGEILSADKVYPEGAATVKRKQQQLSFIFHRPQARFNQPDIPELLKQIAESRSFLRHARVPIWFAYAGKTVAASLKTLAVRQQLDSVGEGNPNPDAEESPVMVKVKKLKEYFPFMWNQAALRGLEHDSILEGMKLGKKYFGLGENAKWLFIIVAVVVVVLGVVAGLAIYFR